MGPRSWRKWRQDGNKSRQPYALEWNTGKRQVEKIDWVVRLIEFQTKEAKKLRKKGEFSWYEGKGAMEWTWKCTSVTREDFFRKTALNKWWKGRDEAAGLNMAEERKEYRMECATSITHTTTGALRKKQKWHEMSSVITEIKRNKRQEHCTDYTIYRDEEKSSVQ